MSTPEQPDRPENDETRDGETEHDRTGDGETSGRATDAGVPPGQVAHDRLRVRHYGPVPRAGDAGAWTMIFGGRTGDGETHRLTVAELGGMKQTRVGADLHCAGSWTVRDNRWAGVLAADVIAAFPPAPGAAHVIVYGHYGYSASITLADLAADGALLATELDGEPLTPEHGYPVRLVVPHLYSYKGPKWFRGWEYLDSPKRGFWEERGYHLHGDPWLDERYSYQETHPGRPPSPRSAS